MYENDVLRVLMAFFDAMAKWESESKALYRRARMQEIDYDDARTQALAALKRVFGLYCTRSDCPARARYGAPHVSMIPTYGASLEDVLSIEIRGNRAVVMTRQNSGAMFQLRYNLARTEKGWRIEDNRKIVQPDGQEDDWDL